MHKAIAQILSGGIKTEINNKNSNNSNPPNSNQANLDVLSQGSAKHSREASLNAEASKNS